MAAPDASAASAHPFLASQCWADAAAIDGTLCDQSQLGPGLVWAPTLPVCPLCPKAQPAWPECGQQGSRELMAAERGHRRAASSLFYFL